MENKFDIILRSWNRLDYLKRTVASLVTSGALEACERFIVVDNGSTEKGVREFLDDMKCLYRAFLVLLPENRGWSYATNNALGLSRAPFLFISDNDVEYSKDFHKKMFETFEHHPNIGILGVWRHTAHGFLKGGIMDEWFREMDQVPGVGWMLPKAAMQEVGMFDERGTCLTKGGNGEDVDYVLRMREAGYFIGVTKEDLAQHITGY